jgi:ABC-type Fe3+/spermidine/putrescine transport system ATPase subunit
MPLFPSLLDRVLVMAFGTVIQIDTPASLFDRLKNQLANAFVGTMNFVVATVHGANGGQSIEIAGLGRQKLNGIAGPYSDGEEALIAIRPESLTLSSFPPGHAHPASPVGCRPASISAGGRPCTSRLRAARSG